MRMTRKALITRGTLAASAATLATLALSVPAPAAVTIGVDTSTPSGSSSGCGIPGGCTIATIQHPTRLLAAPFDGVIVRWRVQGGSGTSSMTPRVIRQLPGGTYIGAGTGAPEMILGGAERTIPTRLPVLAGDLFGVDIAEAG